MAPVTENHECCRLRSLVIISGVWLSGGLLISISAFYGERGGGISGAKSKRTERRSNEKYLEKLAISRAVWPRSLFLLFLSMSFILSTRGRSFLKASRVYVCVCVAVFEVVA